MLNNQNKSSSNADFEILVNRFFSGVASVNEMDRLEKLLEDTDNSLAFEEYARLHFQVYCYKWSQQQEPLIKIPRVSRKRRFLLPVAAITLLLIGLYVFRPIALDLTLQPDDLPVTLTLEQGDIIPIDKNFTEVHDSTGRVLSKKEADVLVYSKNTLVEMWNTLTVPKGKTFQVILSDSSKVILNAGSTLRYPVQFKSGEERSVFLTGEAYFDIQHDPNRPFWVRSGAIQIEVLGTQFNVMNYPEEDRIDVILVSGGLALQAEDAPTLKLHPNQLGRYDLSQKKFDRIPVNPKPYIEWRNGRIIFRGQTFGQIAKRLERTYNIAIEIKNSELAQTQFFASFNTDDSIIDVLKYFQKVHEIDFKVIDRQTVLIQ